MGNSPPRRPDEDSPATRLLRVAAAALDVPLALLAVRVGEVWSVHAAVGVDPERIPTLAGCTVCDRALGGAVLLEQVDESALGEALAGLDAVACAAVALPTGRGRRAALLAIDRERRDWGDPDLQALEDAASVLARELREPKGWEAHAHRAEAHYRRLFVTVPMGVYALDAEGRFTELNPAAEGIVRRQAESLIGRHFAEVVAPEDIAPAEDLMRRMVAGEAGTEELELHLRRPDGERRLVNVRVTPIRTANDVLGVHGVVRDITEERMREKYAHRSERLATVGTLLSGIAHELNNPLNAVRNFAQLMLMDPRSADDQESLEIIVSEADRAAKIVADLRMVARRTGEPGSGHDVVDLNDVVRQVVKLRRYALETKGVRLSEQLAGSLPPLLANVHDLEQVLLHLLINAEEAVAEQAPPRWIEIRTRALPGGVQLQVADSGPGIPSQSLERVFDPFWTTKAPGEGTGLGLSLVHGIVGDHGGEIGVENAPGGGAVFTVRLPRAPRAEEGGAEEPPELDPPARRLHVLVVDDEPPVRRSMATYLRRRGHDVAEARDGAEALQRLLGERSSYDVILTDLRMPGIGGEELMKRLRADRGGLDRRVVVVTGDVGSGEAAALVESIGAPVLIKPVRLDEMARVVEAHADRSILNQTEPG